MGQDVGEEFSDVGEDRPTLLDGEGDAGEVVVQKHHVRRRSGHIGARLAHRDADVRLPQRWGIVHAVTRYGHDVSLRLECLHDAQLLIGAHPGEEDLRQVEGQLKLGPGHPP
jgi:hypothetical protein